MINTIIERNLDRMAKELLKSKDPLIEKFLNETKKNGADEEIQLDTLKTIVKDVMVCNDGDYVETLHEGIMSFLSVMEMHNEYYEFHVELKDDVIQSSRDIRLPAHLMVSDLAYAVLSAYDAIGSHTFRLVYRGDTFCLPEVMDEYADVDDTYPAFMVPLGVLELRARSTIKMIYDEGECWEFEIKYKGKRKCDFMSNIPVLISGQGYNIWEDSRQLLEMLINDPKSIAAEFEGKEITVQECADAEHITCLREDQYRDFIDSIDEFKEIYEGPFFDEEESNSELFYQA